MADAMIQNAGMYFHLVGEVELYKSAYYLPLLADDDNMIVVTAQTLASNISTSDEQAQKCLDSLIKQTFLVKTGKDEYMINPIFIWRDHDDDHFDAVCRFYLIRAEQYSLSHRQPG